MKMKNSLAVLFAGLSLFAGAAYAGGTVYYPAPAYMPPPVAYVAPAPVAFVPMQPVQQWYFGAGAGQSQFRNAEGANSLGQTGQVNANRVDDTDNNAYKVFLGYRFNRNFAVEAGYTDLGNSQASNGATVAQGKAKGWSGDAVGILPLGRGLDLFAKVGAFRWTADAATTTAGASNTASASGTSAKYGVGADFRLSRNVGIRAEYERYKNVGNQNVTGQSDIDLGSISAVFHF